MAMQFFLNGKMSINGKHYNYYWILKNKLKTILHYSKNIYGMNGE